MSDEIVVKIVDAEKLVVFRADEQKLATFADFFGFGFEISEAPPPLQESEAASPALAAWMRLAWWERAACMDAAEADIRRSEAELLALVTLHLQTVAECVDGGDFEVLVGSARELIAEVDKARGRVAATAPGDEGIDPIETEPS